MHPCALLLEAVFTRIRAEKEALAAEDLESAEALSAERAALLQEVWQGREGYDPSLLRDSLLKVREAQQDLRGLAETLHQTLRERQQAGRKQSRYMNAERHLYAQQKKSYYCDKRS